MTNLNLKTVDTEIAKAYILECLEYNNETGELFWLARRPRNHFKTDGAFKTWNTRFAGKLAGYKNPDGYTLVKVGGCLLLSHRIVLLINDVAGLNEKYITDHKDGNRSNNVLSNLVKGDDTINARNKKLSKRNKSGFNGVRWCEKRQDWRARANQYIEGKQIAIYLGGHETAQIAGQVVRDWQLSHGYSERHGTLNA